MELYPGMLVYLNHYSGKRPIVSKVFDNEEETVRILLPDKLKKIRVFTNEPIVLSFQNEKTIYTCEGIIQHVDMDEALLKLRIDNHQSIDNHRIFERFPVSLYATILKPKGKKHAGVVKNMSLSGIAISTKVDLKQGKTYEVEIYIDERVVKIGAQVAWKTRDGIKFEYGMKCIYPDYMVKNTVRLYLSILKEEQENIIKNQLQKNKNFQ